MNGNAIIQELLGKSDALLAAVSEERTRTVMLPANVALPAIVVMTISVVDDQPLARGAWRRQTARVQVSVIAASYRDQVAIVPLVRSACDGAIGSIAGATNVSVLAIGTGPDLTDLDAGTFEQALDFRVTFSTPA